MYRPTRAVFFQLCLEKAASDHTIRQVHAFNRNKVQIHGGLDDLAINVYI